MYVLDGVHPHIAHSSIREIFFEAKLSSSGW
jgi:hypothetical protein